MKSLVIVLRTSIAVQLMEYLNTYEDCTYEYTDKGYFGEREITVFTVNGNPENLAIIKGYCDHAFDSFSITTLYSIKEANEVL